MREGDLALDVCCGTGDIARSLAARGARVVGLDFSDAMLAVAQQHVRSESQPGRVHLIRGDALRLPFPENRFDVVTIGYGLRNLASCEDGLRELLRVLRPGGRLLILDFGKPDNVVWRCLYFGYLRVVVPLFGLLFCGDYQAYAYILESLKHYPGQRGVETELRNRGCTNIHTFHLLGGVMGINAAEKPPPKPRA